MLPDTAERVSQHTAAHINARIEDELEVSAAYHARHPEAIEARLAELDREWNIERTLETNAAAVSLLGVRTAGEIARERYALKALRGDFASVAGATDDRAEAALRAVAR